MNMIVVECDNCRARYDTVAPRSAVELVRRCDHCGGRLQLVEERPDDGRPQVPQPARGDN